MDKNIKPLFCKTKMCDIPEITHNIKKGDLRLLVKGSNLYSSANRLNFKVDKDIIVEVLGLFMESSIFVSPQDLCGNCFGYIPYLVPRGADEWIINVSDTISFEMPKPTVFKRTYVEEK